jgi:hypothetical protein
MGEMAGSNRQQPETIASSITIVGFVVGNGL